MDVAGSIWACRSGLLAAANLSLRLRQTPKSTPTCAYHIPDVAGGFTDIRPSQRTRLTPQSAPFKLRLGGVLEYGGISRRTFYSHKKGCPTLSAHVAEEVGGEN